jgi:hypothetical protein
LKLENLSGSQENQPDFQDLNTSGMAATSKALMPMAVLGRSGLVVSRLSYGAWVSFSYQVGVDGSGDTGTETEGAYALMLAAFKGHSLQQIAVIYLRVGLIYLRISSIKNINKRRWYQLFRQRRSVRGWESRDHHGRVHQAWH